MLNRCFNLKLFSFISMHPFYAYFLRRESINLIFHACNYEKIIYLKHFSLIAHKICLSYFLCTTVIKFSARILFYVILEYSFTWYNKLYSWIQELHVNLQHAISSADEIWAHKKSLELFLRNVKSSYFIFIKKLFLFLFRFLFLVFDQ